MGRQTREVKTPKRSWLDYTKTLSQLIYEKEAQEKKEVKTKVKKTQVKLKSCLNCLDWITEVVNEGEGSIEKRTIGHCNSVPRMRCIRS